MSETELDRLARDFESDESLRRAVESLKSAGAEGLTLPAGDLVELARERGYDIGIEELRTRVETLDDNQLDQVAGGGSLRTGDPSQKIENEKGLLLDFKIVNW